MIRWSARALVALGILHLLVLGLDARGEISGWLSLTQWTLAHWQPFADQPRELAASGAAFWSTIGSFAIPSILLGCLILHLDARGQAVPAFVGWGLLAWFAICALLVEPSGFPAGIPVAAALLAGIRRQARAGTS
ncbi:DUF6463 family protein [Boseaceae bacterium BT-24-1]|nr:DUF6463 family protein [Boseaceae bacterium BT-24-1]